MIGFAALHTTEKTISLYRNPFEAGSDFPFVDPRLLPPWASLIMHALHRFVPFALVAASLSLPACDPLPEDLEEEIVEDEHTERMYALGGFRSGRRLNTNHAGSHWFSELHLDGVSHEDTELLEVVHTDSWGVTMEVDRSSIVLIDGALEADRVDGMRLHHEDFSQTQWFIRVFDSGAFHYRELTVETGFDAPSGTPLYTFYWRRGEGEEWLPTCDMPDEGPELTAALYADLNVDEFSGDMWHQPRLLYIGCLAGAVGKTAVWNYDLDNLSMYTGEPIRMLEAAVRVVRADVCGDGISHTRPGTPLYVGDHMGINGFPPGGTVGEAVWGTEGVLCLDTPRGNGNSLARPTCPQWQNPNIPMCTGGVEDAFFREPSAVYITTLP